MLATAYLHKNQGTFSPSQLDRLAQARVAIAGLGAYGLGAVQLAQLGVGTGSRGLLRIADPDCFERHNANRQSEATCSNDGLNKTEVIGQRIHDLIPDARVESFPEGVTLENVGAFLEGVDLVVDGVDFLRPDIKLALHRLARERGLPVVGGLLVQRGAIGFVTSPASPVSFEQLFAIPQEPSLRSAWVLPGSRFLINPAAASRPVRLLHYEILCGRRPIPSNSLATAAAHLLLNHWIVCLLLGEPVPSVPILSYIDPLRFEMGTVDLSATLEEHQRSIWTRIAPIYDAFLSQAPVYQELVGRVEADLGGCGRVLEAGCGTGVICERLAARGVEAFGIDNNLAMLAYALRRARGQRSMYVGEGDVEDLFFEDQSFDGYCSNNVVFDADLQATLQEAYRVLKPGGTLIISSSRSTPDLKAMGAGLQGMGSDLIEEFLAVQRDLYAGRCLKHGFQAHGTAHVESTLEALGFSVLRSERVYAGQSFYLVARK